MMAMIVMIVGMMMIALMLFTKIGGSTKYLNLHQKEKKIHFRKKIPFFLADFFENPPVAPPQPVHPWPELRGR